MTTEHPLTPPPELLQQWAVEYWGNPGETIGEGEKYIAHQAARWGADQELEACCEWLEKEGPSGIQLWGDDLRTARRPKPPSLKERALQAWAAVEADTDDQTAMAVIRRALEALPND
jgi:hypothetical protein